MSAATPTTPSPLTTETPAAAHRRAMLRLVGFSTAIACALVRTAVAGEPFPHWDGDPTIIYAPVTGLGPSAALTLDVLTLLSCALALLGVQDYRRRPTWLACAALAAGAAAVLYHGLFRAGGSVDDLRIGSSWLAALVTGATAHQVCRHEQLRRIALGAAFGIVAMLALKGFVQVVYEHPQTIAMYRENRDQFLAAHGWSPDSPSALAYERRLMQNEATGWFGLSNVYASFTACTTVGLIALGLRAAAMKHGKSPTGLAPWTAPAVALGGLLSFTALCIAWSKGGSVAAALGLALLMAVSIAQRRAPRAVTARLASAACLAVVGLSLLAVVARALLGDRLGELSLYFRWFYAQASARIIAHHPLWGVGPAGFKDAYMLHKPPLSPEEVTSPHSILLDLASTLGLAGLALGVLWLAWVWGLGPALARTGVPTDEQPAPSSDLPHRIEPRSLFLIACAPTLVGAYCEAQAATIEGGLIRLVGLAATTVLAAAIADALRTRPALVSALAAGAVALAAHAQIEVTPVIPAACPWFMLVFGALSAPVIAPPPATAESPAPKPGRPSPTLIAALPASLVLAAVTLSLAGLIPTWRWESNLKSAAEVLRDATRFRERISTLDPGGPGHADMLGAIAADLSTAVGRTVNRDTAAVTAAFRELQLASASAAADHLLEASRAWPTHAETLRAASKLDLQIADTLRLHTDDAAALRHADRAEKLAVDAAALPRGAAASNAWLATVRAARAESFGDRQALQRAVLAWESAARLDPRGLSAPIQLAQAYARLEKPDQARTWALRALDLDLYTRLDPVKGLSASQRAILQELAR